MIVTSKVFRIATETHFDGFLSPFGFTRTKSEDEEFGFSVTYRCGERYVSIGATLHPHDYPYYLWLNLGDGRDDFPESDWNATALWRFVQHLSPDDYAKEKDLYDISMGLTESDVEEKMRCLRISCEAFGQSFLSGDLAMFKKLRAAQNRDREPYKIYSPKQGGGYEMSYEEGSSRLKKKFSDEAPNPWWKLW